MQLFRINLTNLVEEIKKNYSQYDEIRTNLKQVGNTFHKSCPAITARKKEFLFNNLNKKIKAVRKIIDHKLATTDKKIIRLKNKNSITIEAAENFIIEGRDSKIVDLLMGENCFWYKLGEKESNRNDLFKAVELFKKQKKYKALLEEINHGIKL
ncbi:hypothetical protein REG_0592 [Candidatus Regiella insecticola LSR1]|uniref:Uncharacterized protein n=1 Tax=Candidatus Regiella insecticola LSR1 TaxID=663321 RepID=E0WRI9_9ENTR|nr:hypothetical protein [Candidatus Regiella insecticola]EFL92749.1 hypothetical protein REG_0592 [Candidatus Regiella insecticola LSR1]